MKHRRKILAVASTGGHWQQLLRIRPALDGMTIVFATTQKGRDYEVNGFRCYTLTDASRWNKFKVLVLFAQICVIFLMERPNAVITTGAAPGLLAIILGKFFKARTIWLDSIANVEELSLSGQKAKKWADLWLTQWQHLSDPKGPHFFGAVF